MRTQLILTTAVLGVAGAIGASAQAVYSVNAVGYINVEVAAGKYGLHANQLNVGGNKITEVLPTVPDQTKVFRYAGAAGYVVNEFDGGWALPDMVLAPGTGFFLQAPPAAALKVTFVGEVPQGTGLTTTLVAGQNLVGSQVPQAGTLTALGYGTPAQGIQDGDQVYQWNAATQAYKGVAEFDGGWEVEPTIAVAEGFFLNKKAAGSWKRDFTVN